VWVEFFRGVPLPPLEAALHDGLVVLAPVVAAELLSAPLSARERRKLADLLSALPPHPAPLSHWAAVGALRARLAGKGFSVSTPDAHVAMCAVEACAALWSRDGIFHRIAGHAGFRLYAE
jgi:predicted nucleic acid-binding protein